MKSNFLSKTRLSQCCLQLSLFLLAISIFVVALLAGPFPLMAMGVATIPAISPQMGASSQPITVWYPSESPETTRTMGPFVLSAAWDGIPVRGNGALIVLSHGTGGSSMPHHDLARILVEAGFVVAAPEHNGDNWRDQTRSGPASWKQRPNEVSRAIDYIQGESRFISILDRGRVGVFGMSAGGLTALEFSGATWSLSRLVKHCADHFDEDMRFCAYREVIAAQGKLDDETRQRLKSQFIQGARSGIVEAKEYGYQDGRVKAVVAAVPVGAVIDPTSLRQPRLPTAFVSAEMDQILAPSWHVLALEGTCTSCTTLGMLQNGGHMSILSPLPEGLILNLGPWAKDPPEFDRASLLPLYKSIAQFFLRYL